MKVRIGFITDATAYAEVEVPDDFDPADEAQREDAIGEAWNGLSTGLCHQCANDIELGDFRAYRIADDRTDEEVWSDPDAL